MYIGLFKKPYTVRRYGEQKVTGGYSSAPYEDISARLDVQPLSPDEMMALPEGDRTVKRIKSFGPEMLTSADDYKGVFGDRLFYQGLWYECKSSVMWEHTILHHYRSEFVALQQSDQDPPPTPEPEVIEP